MRITKTSQNHWDVRSDSGMTYEVRWLTKLDEEGCMYFVWRCSCPSHQNPCKHALAVESEWQAVDEEAAERTI